MKKVSTFTPAEELLFTESLPNIIPSKPSKSTLALLKSYSAALQVTKTKSYGTLELLNN